MRWLSSFVIAAFFLFGCRDENVVPNNILPLKEMQPIVWDMMQADELAMQKTLTDSSLVLKQESFKLYDQVFAIHKISRAQFYKSYKYYQEHPKLYQSLMNGVRAIAEKQKKPGQVMTQ